MGNITTTTAAIFIPEVWSKDILRHTRMNLVLANLVKRYDSEVKNSGDTIHIPQLAEVSARTKAAGTDVTYDAATEAELTMTIDQHKYFAFVVEDIVKAQSHTDLREEYTSAAGYALAKAVDSTLAARYAGFSQSVNAGDSLDDADIITGLEKLDSADAPRDNRAFVIHSEQLADMRNLDKFSRYDATGQTGVAVGGRNGLIANAYGVDVFVSNNIVEAANVKHNLLFHKEALGLAMQKAPTTEAEYSVDKLGWKVATHEIYGSSEIRDLFGIDIQVNSP